MNNPRSDSTPPPFSGDPTSAFRSIADPEARLLAARRAQRLAEAKNLSRHYVLIATGLPLLPFPLLDIAVVLALQVKLVHDLAHLYEVPFDAKLAKPLLASLLSCGAVSCGGIVLIGLGMTVPGLTTLVGGGYSGGFAGTTLATSEIFIRHFESGGTLANFEPSPALLPPAVAPTASPGGAQNNGQLEAPSTQEEEQSEAFSPQHDKQTEIAGTEAEGPSETSRPQDAEYLQASASQGEDQLETFYPSAEGQSEASDQTNQNLPAAFSPQNDGQLETGRQEEQQSERASEEQPEVLSPESDEQPIERSTAQNEMLADISSPQNEERPTNPSPDAETAVTTVSRLNDAEPDTKQQVYAISELEIIYGIGSIYANRLRGVGVSDFASLAALQPAALRQILGPRVSLASARDFISQAKSLAQRNSS